MSTQENFKKNIDLKYTVLDIIAREFMNVLLKFYVQNPGYLLDGFVQSELKNLSDSPQLTSFIFNRMNVFNVKLLQQQNIILQQQAQIQKLQAQLQKL